MEHHYSDGTEPTVLPHMSTGRIHRVPLGCDQQGRYPQAAEACTDVGLDTEDDLHDWELMRLMLIISCLISIGFIVMVFV